MKKKVNKLEENSKNKNIREMYQGINEFKKGYQPHAYVTNVLKWRTDSGTNLTIVCRHRWSRKTTMNVDKY